MTHSLSDRNLEDLTAFCSACAERVAIRKAGNGYQCATAKAASQQKWQEANPEKAAENRLRRSEHELTDRDVEKQTATCSQCGPVSTVAWGRGYACAIRAQELRSVQEDAPQERCPVCRVYLTADGTCPRCTDPRHTDLGYALRASAYQSKQDKEALEWVHGTRFLGEKKDEGNNDRLELIVLARNDSAPAERYDSRVPGWKTLGSGRGEASTWWAQNGHLV